MWVLSPSGFAYRRQSFADECAVRLLEWRAYLGTSRAKRKENHRRWHDEHGCKGLCAYAFLERLISHAMHASAHHALICSHASGTRRTMRRARFHICSASRTQVHWMQMLQGHRRRRFKAEVALPRRPMHSHCHINRMLVRCRPSRRQQSLCLCQLSDLLTCHSSGCPLPYPTRRPPWRSTNYPALLWRWCCGHVASHRGSRSSKRCTRRHACMWSQ